VREIQKLNKSKLTFGLNEFSNGTKLILPVIKTTRYFLLDSDVATVYHQIKFYYDILEESLKESFLLVQKEIKSENKAEERRQAEQLRIQTQQRQMQQRQMQQRQMQQRQMQQRQAQPKTQPAPSKQPTNGRKGLSQ
jgi:sensor histidine kinase YesM